MFLVQDLCAKAGPDTFPVSHTRYYPLPDGGISPPDAHEGVGGRADVIVVPGVVVALEFEDRSRWERFCMALGTEEARRMIEEDEAGFWERRGMRVVVAERERT